MGVLDGLSGSIGGLSIVQIFTIVYYFILSLMSIGVIWYLLMRLKNNVLVIIKEQRGDKDVAVGLDIGRLVVDETGYKLKLKGYKTTLKGVPSDCIYNLARLSLWNRIWFRKGVSLKRVGERTFVPIRVRNSEVNPDSIEQMPLEADADMLKELNDESDRKFSFKKTWEKIMPYIVAAAGGIMFFILFFVLVHFLTNVSTMLTSAIQTNADTTAKIADAVDKLDKCKVI